MNKNRLLLVAFAVITFIVILFFTNLHELKEWYFGNLTLVENVKSK